MVIIIIVCILSFVLLFNIFIYETVSNFLPIESDQYGREYSKYSSHTAKDKFSVFYPTAGAFDLGKNLLFVNLACFRDFRASSLFFNHA